MLSTPINEYLTVRTDIIEETGDTVEKYIGDAIMAFWGAPVPANDHARRACEAFLRQIEARRRHGEWERQGKPVPTFRSEINTGDLVVANMGSSSRFNSR